MREAQLLAEWLCRSRRAGRQAETVGRFAARWAEGLRSGGVGVQCQSRRGELMVKGGHHHGGVRRARGSWAGRGGLSAWRTIVGVLGAHSEPRGEVRRCTSGWAGVVTDAMRREQFGRHPASDLPAFAQRGEQHQAVRPLWRGILTPLMPAERSRRSSTAPDPGRRRPAQNDAASMGASTAEPPN